MRQDRFLIVLLVVTLAIAVAGVLPLADDNSVLAIATLFFGAFGAGVSFRALMGVRRRGRDASLSPPRAERVTSRNPKQQQQRRSRSTRAKPSKVERTTGTVKWFDESKGYGFITPESGDKDCFVHRSSVKNGTALVEGKRVEFEITKDERGRRTAANVIPL